MSNAADISDWIERLERRPLAARRTSPDLHAQLAQTLRRPVDRILCLAADLHTDVDLLRKAARSHTDEITAGIDLLRRLVPSKGVMINASYARRFGRRYPALDPVLLIRRVFGRRVRPGAPTTEAGVLLIDAIAAAQLGRLSRDQDPGPLPVVIDDVIADKRIRLEAPPEMPLGDVLMLAGAAHAEAQYFHGPRVQERTVDLATPIGKTELWIQIYPPRPGRNPATCTRCGECVTACPVDLHPAALMEFAQRGQTAAGVRFHAEACIECGLCTDVCPSQLPVLASIRHLKAIQS